MKILEITLKLSEVLNINQALKSIIDDSQIKLSSLMKFKMLGILREINPTVSNFDIIYNEKIVEYGEKQKNGDYKISGDNKQAVSNFNRDIKEVVDSDVTIFIEKLKADKIFESGIKANHLIKLYPIIVSV